MGDVSTVRGGPARVPAARGASRAPPLGSPRYEALLLTAALAFAAGVIHALAAVEHAGDYALAGLFLAALAVAQFAWGGWVFSRPAPGTLLLGAYVSWAIVELWAASRTVGLPLGPWRWHAEPAGGLDVAATGDEIVVAILAAALARGEPAVRRALGLARRPALALLLVSGVALLTGAHHH